MAEGLRAMSLHVATTDRAVSLATGHKDHSRVELPVSS